MHTRLHAFVAVAEHKNFRHAAERLNITQPGLTKRIKALEAEIGGALIDRDYQPIRLTPLGALLLPRAQRLVAEIQLFTDEAASAARGETGKLNIGFGLSAIRIAPQLVARFRSGNPRVTVWMNDFSSSAQIMKIRRDELDLGFVRLPAPQDLDSLPLGTDCLALACSAGMGANDPGDVISCLQKNGLVRLRHDRGPGLSQQVSQWLHGAALRPKIVQEADDIQTVLALVGAGIGCAIVPASSAVLMPDGLTWIKIEGEQASWSVGAVWRPARNVGALARLVRVLMTSGISQDSDISEAPPG